ncbi:MAG: hypothetical protein ABJF50_20425 [Paracoccaceae bacterium]
MYASAARQQLGANRQHWGRFMKGVGFKGVIFMRGLIAMRGQSCEFEQRWFNKAKKAWVNCAEAANNQDALITLKLVATLP